MSNGTNREDSDIDVAVVVDKLEGDYFSTRPILWKIRREIEDRIEPLIASFDYHIKSRKHITIPRFLNFSIFYTGRIGKETPGHYQRIQPTGNVI